MQNESTGEINIVEHDGSDREDLGGDKYGQVRETIILLL